MIAVAPPTTNPPLRRRRVVNARNRDGFVELGPMTDAYGLGDTLTITPCAESIPHAMMLMPERMRYLAPLFDRLCPVQITDNYPVFPWAGGKPVTESNLAVMGIPGKGRLPVVKLTHEEIVQAHADLARYRNPVALVPTCARGWRTRRGTTPEFMAPIVKALSERFTVLQFGYEDFPLIPGAVRIEFKDLRSLAARYHVIGCYCGLNTGDYHLMLAVGGRCLVMDPPASLTIYNPAMWRYNIPTRARYIDMRDQKRILDNLQFLQ